LILHQVWLLIFLECLELLWRRISDNALHKGKNNLYKYFLTNILVAPLSIIYRCNHAQTIVAVAYQTQVSHPNASMCAEGQHTSHEAFVLTECDVPQTPNTWKQGVNVCYNLYFFHKCLILHSFANYFNAFNEFNKYFIKNLIILCIAFEKQC
jgi:hypothetical protein